MNIDWQRVALNLRRHYKPLAQVAVEVGTTEKHINRLARGEVTKPDFVVGIKLLDLHYDHAPNHEEALR